jgi:hypothetical protein
MSAIQELIDAIEGIQDWRGTHVGDCIAAVEAEQFADTSDLRSRLADAQARAERAEGDLAALKHELLDQHQFRNENDYGAELPKWAVKMIEDAPAPQGRTDGERDERARFERWAEAYGMNISRSVIEKDSYSWSNTRDAWTGWLAAMDATAPEVKGGAA